MNSQPTDIAARATPSAIVIVCDLLPASLLAPWGCTWLETPAVSKLASESLLIETHLASSSSLSTLYRSLWQGLHPLVSDSADARLLIDQIAAQQFDSTLITDEPELVAHPAAERFSQVIHLPPASDVEPAEVVEETGMFQLAQLAIEHLSQSQPGSLTWIHFQGLAAPWDAPTKWREELADEDDPEPPTTTAPPVLDVTETTDPDVLLGWQQAAAAQVRAWDAVLGELMSAIDSRVQNPAAGGDPQGDSAPHDPLVIFTSPRGYPLGFHGRIGPAGAPLYSDLLHTPLTIRFPIDPATGSRPGKLYRIHALTQPEHLHELLVDHFQLSQSGTPSALRAIATDLDTPPLDRAVAAERDERMLRTPAWQMLTQQRDGETVEHLFAKADDRWEVNEVARRLPQITALLAAELQQFEAAARVPALASLPKVPELLCDQQH